MKSSFQHVSLIKRMLLFLLIILGSFGAFTNLKASLIFNMDEYQHTYLAWSSVYFNKTIFKDHFDNHGIIYNYLNQVYLMLFKPRAGLDALFSLRSLVLFLLLINLLCVSELFWQLSGSLRYAALMPLLFSFSAVSRKAIEIRPDMLMGIFLNLTVLLLIVSFRKIHLAYARVAGLTATLMLLTNIKSLIVISGIYLGFTAVILCFQNHSKANIKLVLNFSISLVFCYLLALALMGLNGMLENYIKCCFLMNLQYVQHYMKPEILSHRNASYLSEDLFLLITFCVSFTFWVCRFIYKRIACHKNYLFLTFVILTMALGKLAGLWLQYDLMFIPLLCAIASWAILTALNFAISKFYCLRNHSALAVFFIISTCSLYSWIFAADRQSPQYSYLKAAENRFRKIELTLKENETVEAFNSMCPAFGFAEHASYLILKFQPLMSVYELVEQRSVFGPSYIEILEQKRVRFLIGHRQILNYFQPGVSQYIRQNYEFQDCLWSRKTEF